MKYYLALEKKRAPAAVNKDNADIERSQLELELCLLTATDETPLPEGRFELVKTYDEIPEEWDRYFPELKGRTGAVKRTGMYFGFSGTADEKTKVIEFIEEQMNEGKPA
jgi:hypothetical protein